VFLRFELVVAPTLECLSSRQRSVTFAFVVFSCGVLQCEPEEEEVDAGLGDGPCSPLSSDASELIEQLMSHIDANGDGSVSMEEAVQFWSAALPGSYLKPASSQTEDHVRQLFVDVDADLDGRLTLFEFVRFFERLKQSGHSDEFIVATCEAILENGIWGAWKTNRHIVHAQAWDFEPSEAVVGGAASCTASTSQVNRCRVKSVVIGAEDPTL